jgi:hypothetical protein
MTLSKQVLEENEINGYARNDQYNPSGASPSTTVPY